MQQKIKLLLILSHSGACSRRRALDLILSGQVSVNGKIIREPSVIIDPENSEVLLDGRPIKARTHTHVLLNKPAGYVTTLKDPHAEKTVLDLLPQDLKHLRPAGRLDKDTEGLLIFTNDGELIYRLTHPKFNIDKTYLVKIDAELTYSQKIRLEKGIDLDGRSTSAAKISRLCTEKGKSEFRITIHEGRKRQIRRMLEAVGHKVLALKRISQASLSLGDLPTGKWRFLSEQEISFLKK